MIQKLKKNDKGFTLVELIVVIAILGVLMAVLVPQYIRYVEKSRIGVDNSYIAEVAHNVALQTSLVDGAADATYTIVFTAKTGAYTITPNPATATSIEADVKLVVPPTGFKSKKFTTAAPADVSVKDGVVTNTNTALS